MQFIGFYMIMCSGARFPGSQVDFTYFGVADLVCRVGDRSARYICRVWG